MQLNYKIRIIEYWEPRKADKEFENMWDYQTRLNIVEKLLLHLGTIQDSLQIGKLDTGHKRLTKAGLLSCATEKHVNVISFRR